MKHIRDRIIEKLDHFIFIQIPPSAWFHVGKFSTMRPITGLVREELIKIEKLSIKT